MPNDILGGGIFFAIAAGLWLLYLMPNWAKRREYLTTERNALRLQQTLRVMAETAEIPKEVSVAMNSRAIHEQQRILLEQQKIQQAQVRARQAADARRVKAELKEVTQMGTQQRARIRRSRLISTVLLAASVIAIIVSLVFLGSGIAGYAWLLGAALATGIGSAIVLRQLASVSQSLRVERSKFAQEPTNLTRKAAHQPVRVAELPLAPVDRSWQPTELPKPLYLSRQGSGSLAVPKPATAAVNLQANTSPREALLAEAQRSVERVRQVEAALPSIRQTDDEHVGTIASNAEAETADSRFSRMGVIDQSQIARPNFDEALRRRRSAS